MQFFLQGYAVEGTRLSSLKIRLGGKSDVDWFCERRDRCHPF